MDYTDGRRQAKRTWPVPASIQEFIGQLYAAAGNAGRAYTSGPASPAPTVLPGALSAAQMAAIADSIAAQRRSIEALKTQLSAFDEQLAALENFLGPLTQWSSAWADLEQRFLTMGQRPESGG